MRAMHDLLFSPASEEDLNELMAGKLPDLAGPWHPQLSQIRTSHDFGVIIDWNGQVARPLAVISEQSQLPRLFARFSQLRSEFSPVSSWCHIFTPRTFQALDDVRRAPALFSLETGWAGLAIAEAQLLSGIALPKLRIAACYATQSFAIGRSVALWPHISLDEITGVYEDSRRLLKSADNANTNRALRPLWEIFYSLSGGKEKSTRRKYRAIVETLERFRERSIDDSPKRIPWFLDPLRAVTPLAYQAVELERLAPEGRLKLFDEAVRELSRCKDDVDSEEYLGLALFAGFLATIAAGGAPSLSLAERQARNHPAILAWAYAVGGLGAKVTWTSSFEGLGRFVVRELMRPLHIDEPPVCDFCFRELQVLSDPALSDPLVHLRIKQARTVIVALQPGVNVTFALADGQRSERTTATQFAQTDREPRAVGSDNLLAQIAQALVPYLRDELGPRQEQSTARGRPPRKKTAASSRDGDLPLIGGKK